MSSSSTSSTTEQNEQQQQQIPRTPTIEHSVSSQPSIDNSIITYSQTAPVLAGQILTQNDHENYLIVDIDDIICNFLSRFNGQQTYETVLRWTRNDIPNLKYHVVVHINRLEDF
jgi:hypothetical protein